MLWAYNCKGEKIRATRGETAFCPLCKNEVTGKAGVIINTPYWSHKKDECDSWAKQDPETQWHVDWKNLFPTDQQEVPLGEHRADVKTERMVVEFQNSSIRVEDIWNREQFYGNLVWIFNCQEAFSNERISLFSLSEYGNSWDRGIPWSPKGYLSRSVEFYDPMQRLRVVVWSHRKKSILKCRKPVLLDLGNDLLFNTYYWGYPQSTYCNCGLGHILTTDEFFKSVSGTDDLNQSTFHPLSHKPETHDCACRRLLKEKYLLNSKNITTPEEGDPS